MTVFNLSTWIEILSLKFPGYFLVIASLANICDNSAYIAESASRARVNLQFAKSGNIGDIQAKTYS